MLVFDTVTVPEAERADAVSTAMLEATLSTNLVHHDPWDVWLRIDQVSLGPVELTRVTTSGMDTIRTQRQAGSSDQVPTVALSTGVGPAGVIEQDGREVTTRTDAVNLVELTRPYRSRIPVGTDGWSVKIPISDLYLPDGTIRRARASVAASPVHAVFAQHVRALGREAGRLDGVTSSELLGAATIALARALIASAAGADRHAREALADTLLLRMRAYVRSHLTDPLLGPAQIAAAHGVSVRRLYQVFADVGLSLEQWIIELRLDGARRELARPESDHRTIAAVARRWCFADPSHFTHRFREAYGMTPREWRERQARPS
jgi:AraC-like DNA-binding protein